MGLKVNIYSAKTTSSSYSLDIETLSIEFAIGIICTVIAIAGYQSQLLLIFIPFLIIAVACFSLISYNLYQYFSDKKNSQSSSTKKSD
ncbi:hypothetical protein [Pseudoalteromonas sp. MMG024]|uniref:hypothetical protein n=1 Tax=Pseudoalteromonas sp. MMG024 TaxID=2909980 RepID=UPI001F1D4E2A|nr:hypothetical protein [Pseudoalteromonas sp. MMG024]MCF6457382.1 hypothetical protein [Pseudoalteromonas sp. MMG024]